ncbi:hypothetical protein ACS0TY_014091 [Phlomoides rotata]
MGAAKVENAWTIRRVLRNMVMALGLKMNFEKCCLFGVNVGENMLRAMAEILGCGVDTLPFSYLGIKVGVNHRSAAEWSGVVQKIRNCVKS